MLEAAMKRLVKIWLALLGAFWLTQATVSAVLFQSFDRGYEAFLLLATVTVLQTLVIGWVTRKSAAPSPLLPLREGLRQPSLRILLLADAVLLVVGWPLAAAVQGPESAGLLVDLYTGLKLLVAGAETAFLAFQGGRAGHPTRSRIWLGLTAAGLLALACTSLVPRWWILLDLIFPGFLEPTVEVALYGLLLGAGMGLLLRVRDVLAEKSAAAALALDGAIGLGLVGVVSSGLLLAASYSSLEQPRDTAVQLFASLAATALLLAMALEANALPQPDEPVSFPEDALSPAGNSRSGQVRGRREAE
jgi:hypothetical protein